MRGQGFNSSGNWVMKLIFANVVVFLLQSIFSTSLVRFEIPLGSRLLVDQMQSMIYYFGLTPVLVVTKYYIWQLFTYMFLHGDFFHIFLNMYALLLFGIPVEQLWGTKKFMFYYFFTGIGAGIVIFIINMASSGAGAFIPTIGASGAVFGLLLAFGVLFPDVELLVFFFIPMKAKYLVVLYGGIELVSLMSSGANSNVSHIGHLGGLLFGGIFFLVTKRRGLEFSARKIKAKLVKETRERDRLNEAVNEPTAERLSSILDRIKKNGVDSLTDDEYQFIKLTGILHAADENICDQGDFNFEDIHCSKCESIESCLIREIKRYM